MKLILSLGAAAGLAAGLFGTAPTTEAPTAAPVTGTVRGKVVFEGEKPEIKPLTIGAEQAKGCCPEGEKVDDTDHSLLLSAEGGVRSVVVTMEVDGAERPKPAEEAVHLDQKGCVFHPHVTLVPVGQKVAFLNSDTVSHNIHTFPIKNTPLNQTVGAAGKLEQVFDKAEEVKVGCDIHPWMSSYVVVTNATHFALTGDDGSFELKGVPPGTHKIELWHEKLGKAKAEVVVKDDGSSEPVEVTMGDSKKKGRRGGR